MLAMSNLSLFKPEALPDHFSALNNMLQHSYSHAKKQLQDGAHLIQGGISVIREEIMDIYDRAETYLSKKVVLPVNNFLKDHLTIESELQLEHVKAQFHDAPFSQDGFAACYFLEENY